MTTPLAFCSACGAAQAPGVRFCGSCGAAQVLRCANCQTELAPGLRFCTRCGSPVGAPAAMRPPPVPGTHPAAGGPPPGPATRRRGFPVKRTILAVLVLGLLGWLFGPMAFAGARSYAQENIPPADPEGLILDLPFDIPLVTPQRMLPAVYGDPPAPNVPAPVLQPARLNPRVQAKAEGSGLDKVRAAAARGQPAVLTREERLALQDLATQGQQAIEEAATLRPTPRSGIAAPGQGQGPSTPAASRPPAITPAQVDAVVAQTAGWLDPPGFQPPAGTPPRPSPQEAVQQVTAVVNRVLPVGGRPSDIVIIDRPQPVVTRPGETGIIDRILPLEFSRPTESLINVALPLAPSPGLEALAALEELRPPSFAQLQQTAQIVRGYIAEAGGRPLDLQVVGIPNSRQSLAIATFQMGQEPGGKLLDSNHLSTLSRMVEVNRDRNLGLGGGMVVIRDPAGKTLGVAAVRTSALEEVASGRVPPQALAQAVGVQLTDPVALAQFLNPSQ